MLAFALPAAAAAEEKVHFPSLDEAATSLDGYLFRPAGEGRHAAVVFLHGCDGLLNKRGAIVSRESAWAQQLTALGYVVLMVDSFTPREQGEMCSAGGFRLQLYRERPKDAYGALRYLQAQDFVRPDRIGVIGWSQGGGTVLLAIPEDSGGRPPELPQGDFAAAVAFYPASCKDESYRMPWKSSVPLLVLVGELDNWTPAAPCKSFVDGAVARGSLVEMQIYPGAYHDFDWPGVATHELLSYRMRSGAAPIAGLDPAAREDALKRVPQFLARYLQD